MCCIVCTEARDLILMLIISVVNFGVSFSDIIVQLQTHTAQPFSIITATFAVLFSIPTIVFATFFLRRNPAGRSRRVYIYGMATWAVSMIISIIRNHKETEKKFGEESGGKEKFMLQASRMEVGFAAALLFLCVVAFGSEPDEAGSWADRVQSPPDKNRDPLNSNQVPPANV